MSDQRLLGEKISDNDVSIVVSSIPVVIHLDDSSKNDKGENVNSNIPENTSISVPITSIKPPTVPSVACISPPELVVEKNNGSNSYESGKNTGFTVSVAKSLLGSDLLQKSASLAMPPPSSTTVKKAKNHVSPGMSMVKWMKLQENRVRPPTRKKISLAEVAKHDSETDCWMVIRNCVYDVTEYIPYHPGGVPELMKGAGKDATTLFNEVHRWVNFDSILRSCLQGYLQVEVGESFEETDEDDVTDVTKSLIVPITRKTMATLPEAKFSQNDANIILQVDTRYNDELSDDNWCVNVLNRERLLLKVILKPPELWMAHVKLLQSLSDDSVLVNFQNSFKRAVITIKKPKLENWKCLGSPLEENNTLVDSRSSSIEGYCTGTIVEKENILHDVIKIGVQAVPSSFVGVPVGFHLKLRLADGSAPARKYTPVIENLVVQDNCTKDLIVAKPCSGSGSSQRKLIYFIVKIYPEGQFTKKLGLLQVNSQLELGSVAGKYDPSFFLECDTLALIAGGTGMTPFVRVLDFLRKRSATYPISRIALIFFNHSERDIIWRDQFAKLADTWNIFHFFPVISKPDAAWTGLTGRVNDAQLFETIMLQTLGSPDRKADKSLFGKFKAMACGSFGFTEAFVTMLKSQSVVETSATIDEDLFMF